MLGWILLGLLFAGAVLAISFTVAVMISRSNIGQLIRNYMSTLQEEAAKKMLKHAIMGKIKSKGVNVISLDAIDQETGEVIEVEITSDVGIDNSLAVNSTVAI